MYHTLCLLLLCLQMSQLNGTQAASLYTSLCALRHTPHALMHGLGQRMEKVGLSGLHASRVCDLLHAMTSIKANEPGLLERIRQRAQVGAPCHTCYCEIRDVSYAHDVSTSGVRCGQDINTSDVRYAHL